MVKFVFNNKIDFNKAKEILTKSIYGINTQHFNHGIDEESSTISILDDKNTNIINGLFKQNGIGNYRIEEDNTSWVYPKEGAVKPKISVFCDMDGCLTDFNKQLSELLGYPAPKEFGNDPKIWAAISKAGEEFWSEMEWISGARRLWDEIKKFHPTILSAPTRHPSSVSGKKKWLRENLPGVPYIIEQHKEKYAKPGAILIDDRKKNIDKWEAKGGIGILHKSVPDTLIKLAQAIQKLSGESAKETHKKEAMSSFRTVERPDGTKTNIYMPRQQETNPQGGGSPIPSKKEKQEDPKRQRKQKEWKREIFASTLRDMVDQLDYFNE